MRNAHMPLWFFGLCLSAEAQQRTATLFDRLCEEWLFDAEPAPIVRRPADQRHHQSALA